MERQPLQPVEVIPAQTQTFDLSQLAPLVTEFVTELQKGEIEKVRLNKEAEKAIAQMNIDRQKEVDGHAALREARQDRFELSTTILLFCGCAAMMAFGMWKQDNGFITAGVSSFCTYLAGIRAGRGNHVKPGN